MGSPRRSKSTRAKGARSDERRATRESCRESPEIPPGLRNEIAKQRGELVGVITLLHCLHVALEKREDEKQGDSGGEEMSPRVAAVVKWAYLPEMTAMLLERTDSVVSALDSVNLIKAIAVFKP